MQPAPPSALTVYCLAIPCSQPACQCKSPTCRLVVLCAAGTLTIQGLELQSIVPVSNGRFEPPNTDMQQLPPSIPQLLASCHGLAWLGDMLVGDPLDQKLFAATGWSLIDHLAPTAGAAGRQEQEQQQELAAVYPAGHPEQQLRIVRRFEFSSQLMRNLVVVQLRKPTSGGGGSMANGTAAASKQQQQQQQPPGSAQAGGGRRCTSPGSPPPIPPSHMLYVKGSPEVIKELVRPSSVPPDFDAVLAEYTREGLRVLALAQGAVLPGTLPEGAVQSHTQQQLEAAVPLELVGLAVLANPLRPDSADAIKDLQNALVGCCRVIARRGVLCGSGLVLAWLQPVSCRAPVCWLVPYK